MTMFSAACYQFVRSVGKNTLHPAPTIDQKDDIKPLQLVIKSTKRKYFFFHKSVYRPTDFQVCVFQLLKDYSSVTFVGVSSGKTLQSPRLLLVKSMKDMNKVRCPHDKIEKVLKVE